MARKAFLACALVSALVLSHRLYAQGVGASGDIKGMVVDSSGAMMPRANVVATETAKGVRRVATTDSSGRYQITGLEPAIYDVTVQRTGFATEVRKAVAVAIGLTGTLDFQLTVSQVATTISAGAPVSSGTRNRNRPPGSTISFLPRTPPIQGGGEVRDNYRLGTAVRA